jgi:hypothetical protein
MKSNPRHVELNKNIFFIRLSTSIKKIIYFIILLNFCNNILFAQSSENRGIVKNIRIPATNNGNGPIEVVLDLEYQFWRETFDGKTYYLGISYKTVGLSWNQNGGFRMNDKMYMPNLLMAADHRGYHGFEQIKVTGLSMELQIAGINESFIYNDNYSSRARLAVIGKDESINKFNVNILFPIVKYVNWQNDQELRSRITDIANNNAQKENNTLNATNQQSTSNNQTNTRAGLPIESNKNTFNNNQNSTNKATTSNNQTNARSENFTENKNNTFNSSQPSVNSVNTPYNSTNKSSAPVNNDPVNGLAEKMKNQQLQNDQILKNVDNSLTKLANDQRVIGFFNESISSDKKRLDDARQLSGNYSSIEDIEREFSSKMSSIRGITSNIESQRNAKLNYAVGAKFNANATELAIGQGLNVLGSILNGAKAAKDARAAQEELRYQRELEIKKFEEEKKRAILEMRNELFKRFPDGSLPDQQLKIQNKVIYFFAYITEKNKIQDTKPLVTVTNIFPVTKFDDGTFPYKVSIMNKLTGIAPGNISLTGFFETSERAEEIRKVFIKLAESSQLTVSQFQLKTNSKSVSNISKTIAADFWENGKNADSSQLKKQLKKDAFWEN